LEKSSSGWKPVKEGPDKVCDFCKNCENYNFCEKLEKCKHVKKKALTRSAIFAKTARIAIIVKSAKNGKNRQVDVNLSKRAWTRSAISANIVKSAKNWKIRRVSEKLSNRRLRGLQWELQFLQKLKKLQILKTV